MKNAAYRKTPGLEFSPKDREDRGEDRPALDGTDRGAIEPVARRPCELESPHDQGDCKLQRPEDRSAGIAELARLRVDDVAGNPPPRQYELRQEEHGEDHERGEESRNRFRRGELEEVAMPSQSVMRSIPSSDTHYQCPPSGCRQYVTRENITQAAYTSPCRGSAEAPTMAPSRANGPSSYATLPRLLRRLRSKCQAER